MLKIKSPLFLLTNQYSKTASIPLKIDGKYTIKGRPEDVTTIKYNYIGPPDKQSNLRPVAWHIPENETVTQKKLRELRNEVQDWNQNFWTNHNKRFYEERQSFVETNRKSPEETLSADEMSIFYKQFLDKNWKLHFYYNISWYIKNWTMLFMSLRVEIEDVLKSIKKRK